MKNAAAKQMIYWNDKKLKILNTVEKSDQIYLKFSTPVGREKKNKEEEKQKRKMIDMED